MAAVPLVEMSEVMRDEGGQVQGVLDERRMARWIVAARNNYGAAGLGNQEQGEWMGHYDTVV